LTPSPNCIVVIHDEDDWGWSHRGSVIVSLIIKQNKNPTVNIAAGSSVGSVALAATSLNPAGAAAGAATRNTNLRFCWYPTDNKEERTEKKFFDINLKNYTPLFVNEDDQLVFGCNPIELRGLKNRHVHL
jgi:hypothetical protein